MRILPRNFYARPSTLVAKELIGKVLVRNLPQRKLEGIMVETEAYGGLDDPASHAFRGLTNRNRAMFKEVGHTYVYFTYGFHHCLNFVAKRGEGAGAVLIRAVQPVEGLDFMRKQRGVSEILSLCNGPGKLCQAFAIDGKQNEADVTDGNSSIFVVRGSRRYAVSKSVRIGIKKGLDKKWRYYARDNRFVSKFSLKSVSSVV
jgi:DNA-3-methyladenine glycosylase